MFFFLHVFRLMVFACCSFSFAVVWSDLSQETIYLTWQRSPSTTMTIQWVSSPQEKESIVTYRTVKENEDWLMMRGESFPFPQSPRYLIHRVELKNLQPDTEYFFKIAPSPNKYQFLTAPAQWVKELKFVVGGDMYHEAMPFMAKTCCKAQRFRPYCCLGGRYCLRRDRAACACSK